MSTKDLNNLLQQFRESEDNCAQFNDYWSQGRSAYGGLSAAVAVTAMRKTLQSAAAPGGNAAPLRAILVSFIGPIPPGEVQSETVLLRQGKNVSQLRNDLLVDGQVCLQTMGVFGAGREGLTVAADKATPFERESGLSFAEHRKRLPNFLQQFEGYWGNEGLPFSGRAERRLTAWVRHRSDLATFPEEKLVAIADVPPPVILSHFDEPPVPASSLTWSLEFVRPATEIEGDWFYLEFTTEAAAAGYTQQSGRIYDEAGELCALSRQCMVYFG